VVARPDDVCPEKPPAGLERSGVVAVVDPASRQATASVAGVQYAVSTHPVSASGIRPSSRPLSGHRGGRPEGPALGRLLSSRPASSRPVSTRPVSSRLVSAPVRPDASVSSHAQALGTRSSWSGDRDHRNRWRPRWLPGRRRLERRSRRPGRGRRCRTRVGPWEVGGGPGSPGWVVGRGGRPCPLSDQAGPAGVRSARRGRLRGGHGSGLQREVAAPAAWLPSSGWVRDHGGWSSASQTPGWAASEGPGEAPAGMGVRPQRGPSR
jgi:hypothetical protein